MALPPEVRREGRSGALASSSGPSRGLCCAWQGPSPQPDPEQAVSPLQVSASSSVKWGREGELRWSTAPEEGVLFSVPRASQVSGIAETGTLATGLLE